MKTISKHVAIALLLFTIFSCDETTIVKNYTGTGEEKTYSVEGYAQKGPFIIGSAVTISELNDNLNPTGRVFFATILNDDGYFEIPGVVLASPYIQIKVEGRYFGEVNGAVQADELILYSIADVRESQSINVNLITHLIKPRIENLVQQSGKSLTAAKQQAFEELLKAFNWENLSVNNAEELNIVDDNTSGSVLLAISVIFENIGDFNSRLETITNFQSDLRNGEIDDEAVQSMLISSAQAVNVDFVLDNLEYHYGTVDLPDFEQPLSQFIDNTAFINYADIYFPKSFDGTDNLIRKTNTHLTPGTTYYASITIPKGVQSDVLLYMASRTHSQNNRFTTVSSHWDQQYAMGGVQCYDNEEDMSCFETYAMLHRVTFSEDIEIKIPVTFQGTGAMTLYYSAQVNGTSFFKEVEFTW